MACRREHTQRCWPHTPPIPGRMWNLSATAAGSRAPVMLSMMAMAGRSHSEGALNRCRNNVEASLPTASTLGLPSACEQQQTWVHSIIGTESNPYPPYREWDMRWQYAEKARHVGLCMAWGMPNSLSTSLPFTQALSSCSCGSAPWNTRCASTAESRRVACTQNLSWWGM